MGESHDKIYGKIRALEVNSHIRLIVQEYEQLVYKQRFLKKISKYSFKKHRSDESTHEGASFDLKENMTLISKIRRNMLLLSWAT